MLYNKKISSLTPFQVSFVLLLVFYSLSQHVCTLKVCLVHMPVENHTSMWYNISAIYWMSYVNSYCLTILFIFYFFSFCWSIFENTYMSDFIAFIILEQNTNEKLYEEQYCRTIPYWNLTISAPVIMFSLQCIKCGWPCIYCSPWYA